MAGKWRKSWGRLESWGGRNGWDDRYTGVTYLVARQGGRIGASETAGSDGGHPAATKGAERFRKLTCGPEEPSGADIAAVGAEYGQ